MVQQLAWPMYELIVVCCKEDSPVHPLGQQYLWHLLIPSDQAQKWLVICHQIEWPPIYIFMEPLDPCDCDQHFLIQLAVVLLHRG